MANDFSSDSNCRALWRFESGALTTDSVGANTLTNDSSVVTADTDSVNYHEGEASAYFVSSASPRLYINDADLDSGFPLKSSASTADFSLCFWFKLADVAANYILVAKNIYLGSNDESLLLYTRDYGTYYGIRIIKGYNSGNSNEVWEAVASLDLQAGRWYHLGLTWDDSAKQFNIVVWDDTTSTKYTDSDNQSYSMSLTSSPLNLGARADSSGTPNAELNGWLDEVVVFSDILTESEIDSIRQGTYGTSATEHELGGPITASSEILGNLIVTRGLSGSIQATVSSTPVLSAVMAMVGTINVRVRAIASLLRSRSIARTRADWLSEVLLSGATSNALKLGTVLTGGWFWTRRAGCLAVYRGPTLRCVNFGNILSVASADAERVVLPAGLLHEPNSRYCYLVRRYNGSGDAERTTTAALRVRIDSDGDVAEPVPNGVYALSVQMVAGGKIRLNWFYCPLDQEAPPGVFHIYGDDATGRLDLESVLGTVPYQGHRSYSFLSESLAEGSHVFGVAAETGDGILNLALSDVNVAVRSVTPTSLTLLSAEAIAL